MAPSLDATLRLLAEGIQQGLHSGAQIYVSQRGEVAADTAIGEARPGEPLTRDHLMLWLSSSKPVAAVAIAQLWERGQIGLDDRVADHVPEFAQGGKQAITLRHLLTHTGGFRGFEIGWPGATWAEVVARVCSLRLEPGWVPGEKAGYHLSSSWFVLGEVVRRRDGRPFPLYVREEIFAPLGMGDCWIGMPAERFQAYGGRIAPMWMTASAPPRPHAWTDAAHLTACSPGGNGCGPARELGRFYEMLLAGGALAGTRIVSPQAVEALVARHRTGLFDQTFRKVMDWGLGFIPNSGIYGDRDVPYSYGVHASRRAFGHSGYRSSTGFADPEHGLAVALIVNGTPEDGAHLRRFQALTAAIYEDLGLARQAPGEV